MKYKIAKFFIVLGVLIFAGCINVLASTTIEINSVEINEDQVSVKGMIGGSYKQVSCLVTDANEKIAYIDQKASDSSGNFTFEFRMPDWVETGTYTVKCGGEASNSPATATFKYELSSSEETTARIEIVSTNVAEDGKITVNGKISGGVKEVSCLVTDANENIAHIDQKTSNADGTFTFEFYLADWATTGTYTVKCGGEASNSPATATFKYELGSSEETISKIEIIGTNVAKDGKITVSGKISGGNKQVSCLVTDANEKIAYIDQKASNSDGTFTFEFSMPDWAETGTYTVKCGGEASNSPASTTFEYEKVVLAPPASIEITSAIIDANGNVTIEGISSGISGQLTCVLSDATEEEIERTVVKISADGSFTLGFAMPIWTESGTYFVECANESISAKTSLIYNKAPIVIENVNIDKNENYALYTALKRERRQLDSDNDGIITVAELNSLTGSLDLSNRNISDINGLQALTSITDLYINNNIIEKIDVLVNLSNLKILDVSNNNVSQLNTIPKNLSALHIENNAIENAEILRQCKGMVYLFADGNSISDVEFVEVMTNLKTVSIQNNNVVDISSFKNIAGLRYLNLSDNKISDISALKNCKDLYDLRLSNNNIADISLLPRKLFFTIYIDGNNIPMAQKTAVSAIVKKY